MPYLAIFKVVGEWLKTLLLPLVAWWAGRKQVQAAEVKKDNKELREEINALNQQNKDRADIASLPDIELDGIVYKD